MSSEPRVGTLLVAALASFLEELWLNPPPAQSPLTRDPEARELKRSSGVRGPAADEEPCRHLQLHVLRVALCSMPA